jgi:hypothetical protein
MPGAGLCSTITGTRVFYAGGGQGAPLATQISVAGGGSGQPNSGEVATSAIANSGSGGGGNRSSPTFGGNGGSGIVIIRYPATQSPPASFGGANTPQISYADNYQIYTFTSSGTITF